MLTSYRKLVVFLKSCCFWLLVAANGILLSLRIKENIHVATANSEEIAKYPFGTESGFGYLSPDHYVASGILWIMIYLQALVGGGFSYWLQKPFIAILFLLSPMITAFLLFPYSK